MSIAHRRKKQPEAVRHQLLDVAARLCIQNNGLHALTLDAVAKEAGVSKGGLLHHFSTKQLLLDALFNGCLENLDRQLATYLDEDEDAQGRFARAYLLVMANSRANPDVERWSSLGALFIADERMRAKWNDWLTKRNAEHRSTDSALSSLIVRLASDGLWLSDMAGSPGVSQANRKKVIAQLVAMTSSGS